MSNITSGYVRADVGTDGVASIWIKATGDTAYYSVPNLADAGEIVSTGLFELDSLGAERAYAMSFEAKFSSLNTDKTSMIKLLDTLGYYDVDCIIVGLSGATYSSANITSTTTGPYCGLKWTFRSDADYDKSRKVDFVLDRVMQLNPTDEWTLFTNTNPALTGQTSNDKLWALNALTQNSIIPAGVQKVAVTPAGVAVGTESLGEIRNFKFTAELVTYKNKYGMSKGKAIKIIVEVEATQASKIELQLLKAMATQPLDHIITFNDGTVFSTASITGARLGFSAVNTMKVSISTDPTFVKYTFTGYLKLDVAGVWDSCWT